MTTKYLNETTRTAVLAASDQGCLVIGESGEVERELDDRRVGALAPDADGGCLTVVDEREVWRRDPTGHWSCVGNACFAVQSLCASGSHVLVGGMDEAIVSRIDADGSVTRLAGFDSIAGRDRWFAGGPPLGVRSLAASADGSVLLAGVHVGGIPRSTDGGLTWKPTIPIEYDVHEVCWHPSLPHVAAAATAIGLCVSHDAGENWRVVSYGPVHPNSLALSILADEALIGFSEGPFASRSQLWRWPIGADRLEQVRDGLPEWLDGKIDTGWVASDNGRAVVLDGGGHLWLSASGSRGWRQVADGLDYSSGILLV